MSDSLPVDTLLLRLLLAGLAAVALALLTARPLIRFLARRAAEPNCSDSPRLSQLHQAKDKTPSMGGLIILLAAALPVVLLADLQAPWMPALALVVFGLAALGAADDLVKIRGRRGLSARAKLAGQTLVGLAAAALLYPSLAALPQGLALPLPGTASSLSLGFWFIPFAAVVIVSFSNAVNLTDGLDGLASGCALATLAVLGLAAWAMADPARAATLHLPHLPGAGEFAVPVSAVLGALAGFLAFNRHPARVFMGDTGSLPLGGLIGFLAVAMRVEWLVLVAGGVFVAEAASVVIQVASYRLRKKRVFRCAPLHHHFQFLGWPESKVVARFWTAAAVLAVVAIGIHWNPPSSHSRLSLRETSVLSQSERLPSVPISLPEDVR